MYYRADFFFSYWLVAWYIFYELGITKYNPKIGLFIAFIQNTILLCLMIYFKNSFFHMITLIMGIFFFKIIPLWRLRNTTYKLVDIYALVSLFIIYLIWLIVNNFNFAQYPKDVLDGLKNDDPVAPFTHTISNLLKSI